MTTKITIKPQHPEGVRRAETSEGIDLSNRQMRRIIHGRASMPVGNWARQIVHTQPPRNKIVDVDERIEKATYLLGLMLERYEIDEHRQRWDIVVNAQNYWVGVKYDGLAKRLSNPNDEVSVGNIPHDYGGNEYAHI